MTLFSKYITTSGIFVMAAVIQMKGKRGLYRMQASLGKWGAQSRSREVAALNMVDAATKEIESLYCVKDPVTQKQNG